MDQKTPENNMLGDGWSSSVIATANPLENNAKDPKLVAVKKYRFDEAGYEDKQRHLQHQFDTERAVLNHLTQKNCQSIPKLLGVTKSSIILEKINGIDPYEINLQNWDFVSELLLTVSKAFTEVYKCGAVNWDPKAKTFIFIPDQNGELVAKVYDFNVAALIDEKGQIEISKGLVKSESAPPEVRKFILPEGEEFPQKFNAEKIFVYSLSFIISELLTETQKDPYHKTVFSFYNRDKGKFNNRKFLRAVSKKLKMKKLPQQFKLVGQLLELGMIGDPKRRIDEVKFNSILEEICKEK